MSGKSGVYLVSSSPADDSTGVDNQGFSSAKYSSPDDVDVSIPEKQPHSDKPYRGMGKEELLRHSSKPFWRRLRMIFAAIIILGWLALIITVVALVLIYPRCKAAPPRDWWQQSPIYRIYVRSFQEYLDSGSDGIGDIKGVEARLPYIKNLGVETISLSTIYQTSSEDNDFDIIDHMNVDSVYGTMADIKSLINSTHSMGMKLILDFVPNHTSNKHPWFVLSASANPGEKRNYYVWADGATPSNWRSVYDQPAWTSNADRNQSYLHQFLESEPDLNLRSSLVQEELETILRFWLDLGVDGFYIRRMGYLFEDYDLRDEEKATGTETDDTKYDYYDHKYTYGLAEIHDMIARWRTVLDEYNNSTQSERFLMGDIKGDVSKVVSYYGQFGRDGLQIAINNWFIDDSGTCDGECIGLYVDNWMDNLPDGKWPNWLIGGDESKRIESRFGTNFTRAFSMLTMLLPGTPIAYYGDEINMADSTDTSGITASSSKQIMRSPMQWDNSTYAGFSTVTPWMSVNADSKSINVEFQNMTADSTMSLFKNLTNLRKQQSFLIGDYIPMLKNENLFSFVREFDGETGYLVAINFGSGDVTADFMSAHNTIPETTKVELTTGPEVGYSAGDDVDPSSLTLVPNGGIVVSWDYVAKEI